MAEIHAKKQGRKKYRDDADCASTEDALFSVFFLSG